MQTVFFRHREIRSNIYCISSGWCQCIAQNNPVHKTNAEFMSNWTVAKRRYREQRDENKIAVWSLSYWESCRSLIRRTSWKMPKSCERIIRCMHFVCIHFQLPFHLTLARVSCSLLAYMFCKLLISFISCTSHFYCYKVFTSVISEAIDCSLLQHLLLHLKYIYINLIFYLL